MAEQEQLDNTMIEMDGTENKCESDGDVSADSHMVRVSAASWRPPSLLPRQKNTLPRATSAVNTEQVDGCSSLVLAAHSHPLINKRTVHLFKSTTV